MPSELPTPSGNSENARADAGSSPRHRVVAYTERKINRYTFNRLTLKPGSFLFKVAALDYFGTLTMLGCITCLLLPLQWGGNQ